MLCDNLESYLDCNCNADIKRHFLKVLTYFTSVWYFSQTFLTRNYVYFHIGYVTETISFANTTYTIWHVIVFRQFVAAVKLSNQKNFKILNHFIDYRFFAFWKTIFELNLLNKLNYYVQCTLILVDKCTTYFFARLDKSEVGLKKSYRCL